MKLVLIDAFNYTLIGIAATMRAGGITDENNKNFLSSFGYIINGMLNNLTKRFGKDSTYYVCWDSAGGTQFRKDLDSSYKDSPSRERFVDIKYILEAKDIYSSRGFINVELEQTEADDTAFVLAKVLREKYPQSEIVAVSRDKDWIQIDQSNYADTLFDPVKKKDIDIPWYPIVDYKALVGDPSDNLSGVKGIGPKTANKLLAEKLLTGKLNLKESQIEEFEKFKNIIDATRHPLFDTNVEKIRSMLV